MSLYLLMKLLPMLAAFWMISGVIGRDLTFWRAGKVTDVQTALNDKVMIRYRAVEFVVLVIIIVLMVTKPF